MTSTWIVIELNSIELIRLAMFIEFWFPFTTFPRFHSFMNVKRNFCLSNKLGDIQNSLTAFILLFMKRVPWDILLFKRLSLVAHTHTHTHIRNMFLKVLSTLCDYFSSKNLHFLILKSTFFNMYDNIMFQKKKKKFQSLQLHFIHSEIN